MQLNVFGAHKLLSVNLQDDDVPFFFLQINAPTLCNIECKRYDLYVAVSAYNMVAGGQII